MPVDQHAPSSSDRRGHVGLVTGAASGLGAATALLFAQQGMHVVVLDIDEGRVHDTVAQIERVGGTASSVGCATVMTARSRRRSRARVIPSTS